ncbi:hypothetical protein CFP65_5832 [Kitasatospora sp. MMS16-BH015]|uniref:ATP-binding protein n=1 Tax=Kitasatospora sp. MMS16-BH015 TaxID=2018025 RepID=UPI000CA283C9|nr:hypothetical protein [Kitasatospora sp. MMS16-BH015]AUG80514.1 hypothetical protein CFP65_5832 [Kitasatospora sp. MMS16-BH015]
MKRLGVVYDEGAASFGEIQPGVARLAAPVFLLPPGEHNRRLLPLIRRGGETVLLTGDHAQDVATVRAVGLDGIVTFSEQQLARTALFAEGAGLVSHTPATVRLLTDKLAQRERLARAGVDTVPSCPVPTVQALRAALLAPVGLPAVLKPRTGSGSRETHLITDPETGSRLLRRALAGAVAEEFVLESYLAGADTAPFGDYVSVESAVVDGRVHHLAVTGKLPLAPPFRETAQFWPSQLPGPEREGVERLATGALRALGVTTGITHTEIKLTPAGPRIIEVNGRLGGLVQELAVRAAGLDLVGLSGAIALGERPDPRGAGPERVYFQYTNPAPRFPSVLSSVEGVDEVLRQPGITAYIPHVRPGTSLPGGVMTQTLDLLCGHAPDHAAMLDTIARALDTLRFSFATETGQTILTATQLTR